MTLTEPQEEFTRRNVTKNQEKGRCGVLTGLLLLK